MAATKLVEPYVKASERIRAYPVLLDITGENNIGGVIVAPSGPHLSYVTGPNDFLKKFTVDGEIPRNADISFINAYYLSFASGLVIARSMNTTAVNGMYFKVSTGYKSQILINADDSAVWGLQVNDKYYYYGADTWSDFKDLVKSLVDDNDDPILTSDQVTSLNAFAEANTTAVESLSDLADKIVADNKGTTAGLTGTYSESIGAIVFSSSVQFDPNVALNIELACKLESEEDSTTGLEGIKMNFKNGVALTELQTIQLVFGGKGVEDNWAFIYGAMAYYHGVVDKSKYADYSLKSVESLDDVVSSINGIAGMNAELTTEYSDTNKTAMITVQYSKGNKLESPTDSPLNVNVTVTCTDGDSSFTDFNNKLFAVYPDDPQGMDAFQMMIQPDTKDNFLLTLYHDDTQETYTVSLMPDALDTTGNNCFIENLNALGTGFTFLTNSDFKLGDLKGEEAIQAATPELIQVFSFGDSGLDLSSCGRIPNKINALYDLEDQELYDIEYLAPFGECNLQFIKNYVLVGKRNDWFTPVDIPYDKTNANSIKGYFLNVDRTSNAIGMGPFDKNTGLTGWMNYIACSTLYYTQVMANTAANKAWAPCFDLTNGVLDFTNPVYMLGKTEREQLLNFKAPVNFLKFDQRANVYYLNDNWTHQTERNIVSEEQNRRCVNKIKKDCKRILKSFKGRTNTVSTRADVVSSLNYYFNSQVMTQEYRPNEFNIICDETNNTVEVITSNHLAVTVQVRLENAIKYIDVLVDVFPLGVDFNS